MGDVNLIIDSKIGNREAVLTHLLSVHGKENKTDISPSCSKGILRSSKACHRRMVIESRLLALSFQVKNTVESSLVQDSFLEKKELVEKTIAKMEWEIQNREIHGAEDRRLISIAKKLKDKLTAFILRLNAFPVPGCCFYEGEDYLVNVVAIAEKQERVENAIRLIKITPGISLKVQEYFQRTLDKLKQGINVPLPDFFHATRSGLEGIIEDQTIRQSLQGAAGPGTYISCNNEGDYGYGSHAFAIDESCLVGSSAKFFTGRKPGGNVFYSLWASVLRDIPISEKIIAYIDTSADDIPYVQELLLEHNLNIEVIDRETSAEILRIFDLSTKRLELPSFNWSKLNQDDYLPSNMYPRSEQGTFREFMPTG